MNANMISRLAATTIKAPPRYTASLTSMATRLYSTTIAGASSAHKVVIVGGGTAGLGVSHQLLRSGNFKDKDIAVVDPATWHDYQPGWTLVGGGLKKKQDLRARLDTLINQKLAFYNEGVAKFHPENNCITLMNGDKVTYDQLVVAPGIKIKYDSIKGLPEALADPSRKVSTIYSYDYCDKLSKCVTDLHRGKAIFTQPAGVIKCAGAPQKAMWLAVDKWSRAGLFKPGNADASAIAVTFATGLPTMFGVPKYSAKLEELRVKRGVEGLFQHDLVEINGDIAVFKLPDGSTVQRQFDLLHATPKMGPHEFVATSPLADAAGYVDVDNHTLQHKKFSNIWSLGDASSLPTSKTAAAITSESPVLVSNILRTLHGKKELNATYDGYTSCPLLTSYGKVMLAEFKYGGEVQETFGKFGLDQAVPRRAFYYLKKDFFPWVYYKFMVKGMWGGPKGLVRKITE